MTKRLLKTVVLALGLLGFYAYFHDMKEASKYVTFKPIQVYDTELRFYKHYWGLPVFGYDTPIVNVLDENPFFDSPRKFIDVLGSYLEIEAYSVRNGAVVRYYVDGYITGRLIGLYAGKFLPSGEIEINPAKVDSAQVEFEKYLKEIKKEKIEWFIFWVLEIPLEERLTFPI